MCGNGIRSWDQFETVLTHELIHAYDYCRADVDPTNLKHHACLEVRASNLSGDCTFMREARLGHFEVTNHQPVRNEKRTGAREHNNEAEDTTHQRHD